MTSIIIIVLLPNMGARITATSPSMPQARNLASFVTNSYYILCLGSFSSLEVPALCELLAPSTEISHLVFTASNYSFTPYSSFADLETAIKNCPALTSLSVDSGKYMTPDRNPGLVRMISHACGRSLQYLFIDGTQISPEEFRMLGCALRCCPALVSLRASGFFRAPELSLVPSVDTAAAIRNRSIKKAAADELILALIGAVEGLESLQSLGICYAEVGEKSAQMLGYILRRMKSVNLSGNCISPKGLSAIMDGFLAAHRPGCVLESLALGGNDIGPSECEKLGKMLRLAPRLRLLDVSRMDLKYTVAVALGKAISRLSALEELNMFDCKLGPEGAVALFSQMSCALIILNVSYNEIEDRGAIIISESVLAHGTIVNLYMRGCRISKIGAKALANALCGARELRSLSIGGNEGIGPDGAVPLLDSLRVRHPMILIMMEGCKIGNAGAEAVGRAIRRTWCKRVHIRGNGIGAAGIRAVVDATCAAGTEILYVGLNPVGDEGAEYIAEKIMRKIIGVTELDISEIGAGTRGMEAVGAAMRAGNWSRELRLGFGRSSRCIFIGEVPNMFD